MKKQYQQMDESMEKREIFLMNYRSNRLIVTG